MSRMISSGGAVREIHFLPLYLLPCPFQRSLCSFIFWGVISRPGGREAMYYLLIPPYLIHSPLWTRGTEWLAQSFSGRSVSSIEIWHWKGKFPRGGTKNALYSIYSTSLWDHQTLYIYDYRKMPSSPSSFHSPFFSFIFVNSYCSIIFRIFGCREGWVILCNWSTAALVQ